MDDTRSASMNEDNAANTVALLLQSLNIEDEADALDGAERTTMVCEAPVPGDIARDVPAMAQSVDVAGDVRAHTLEAKHKIFLSHSGAQKSLVADLCSDLLRCDRYPFFDKLRSSLPVGERFPHLIFDAIRQCEVGVVVVSEEFFTRSKWPMLELVAMVEESKKPNRRISIIPVFYNISRDKCRDPNVQCEWMTKYWRKWEREDKERINAEKWKSALGIFGSTTGLVMKDGILDGELRAEIVEAICKKVPPETRGDDSGVEGKTRLCEEICKMVYNGVQPKDLKDKVRMVGLYGMGGIGKTTACKLLCNELSRDYYDKVCHVELGSNNKVTLLQKVLSKLSDLDAKVLKELEVDVGHRYLKTRIVKDRVFLAVDNMSDESKEEAKSYVGANLGDGSVVLVTARSVELLLCLGVRKDDCFAMVELELEEAKSLFLNCAGLKMSEVGEDLVERCVRRCLFSKGQSLDDWHYHPLALKVLAIEVGDLIRCGMENQSAMLSRIRTFNLSRRKEHPVFSILRSSFDCMLEEDQLLFLDLALRISPSLNIQFRFTRLEWLGMVHGKDGDEMECMLECLKRRSLLESFGRDEYEQWIFGMHDLWREFAEAEMKAGKFRDRRFVYEGGECRGRVDLREYPRLEVVVLDDMVGAVALDVRGLKHLKSLQAGYCLPRDLTAVEAVEVSGLGTLERLTFLQWHGVASIECIAELGLLKNLQVVSLREFRGDKLPDMSELTSLRILDVEWSRSLQCINLRSLPNLEQLGLVGCFSLRSVDISGCRSMRGFPGLPDLEELNASSCPLILSLGEIVYFTSLRKLNITGCSSIEELDKLNCLIKLEELRARECERLAMLPRCHLRQLRVLDIEPGKVLAGSEWALGQFRKLVRRFKRQGATT